jgi:hypothetical protein
MENSLTFDIDYLLQDLFGCALVINQETVLLLLWSSEA